MVGSVLRSLFGVYIDSSLVHG